MDKISPVHSDKTSTEPPQASMDQLVEENYDYLYSYAFRFFRSEDRAEELVQDTFLAAAESYSRFEGRSSARTWLTSILRHKIIDTMRKREREQPVDIAAIERESLTSLFDEHEHWRAEAGPLLWGTPAERTLSQKQFFGVLDQCLKKLPERMRQIFLLREMEDCEREEISSTLGLSSSNVGVILHRARLSLQRCLQINWFQKAGGLS